MPGIFRIRLALWRQRSSLSRLWSVGLGALLVLLLAACGVSAPNIDGASSGSTSSAGPGGAGLAIRPCLGDYAGDLHPALILSSSATVSGSARVGDIIEVRLDGHHKWTLASVKPATALASRVNEGALDRVDGACVWDFQAKEPGDVIITYSGMALCDPTQVCPDSVISQNFTLHIS